MSELQPVTNDASSLPGEPRANSADQFFCTDHLISGLQRRSLRGGVVILGAQGVKFMLGMISTVAMARLLRPQDFGLVAMVTSIFLFVGLFRDLGLSNATVQRAQVTHAQVSFLFWLNVALSLAVAVVAASLAPLIAWFYHEPRLIAITLVLSTTFIFAGASAQHQALLRRQMQFKSIAVRDCVALTGGIVAGISLAWIGFGYWSIVGSQLVGSIISCILLWTICRWRPGPFRRGVGARTMVAYGGNLTASNLLNYFTRNFDNILIGRVLGAASLGVYTKAYGLLMLPIAQINMPMATVLLPGLSRLQNQPQEYARLFGNAVRAIALVTVPIVVFSFCLAEDIVLVLLGPRWISVAPVFQLLAPAALVGAISFAPGWLCQSLGQTRRQLRYAIVSAPVCVGGFFVGINWGIAGVATSYSLTFTVLFWGYVWYASKDSPVRFTEITNAFLAAVVPAIVAGLVVWTLRTWQFPEIHALGALAVGGLIFAGVYSMVVFASAKNRSLIFSALASMRKSVEHRAR